MNLEGWIGYSRRRSVCCLLGVGAIAIALRVPYLTQRSIWFDEAASWHQSQIGLADLPSRLRSDTILPPFFVMLKAWMAVFGASAAGLRLFPVAFGVLTVLGMYLFGREFYRLSYVSCADHAQGAGGSRVSRGRAFALVIALTVATSAFQVNASTEVRMYAPGTACTAFSTWLLLRGLRLGRWREWLAYGLTAAFALYLHPFLLFSVAAQFVAIAASIARLRLRNQNDSAKALAKRSLVAGVIALIVFLPGLPVVVAQHHNVRRSFWITPLDLAKVASTLVHFFDSTAPDRGSCPYVEAAVIALVVLSSGVIVARRAREADYVLLASAFLPLASAALASLVTPVWLSRYFRFAHLYLSTLIVVAAWRPLCRWPLLRDIVLLLLICVSFAGSAQFWARRQIASRPGMRGAIKKVVTLLEPGEIIVAENCLHFLPARYYTPNHIKVKLIEPQWRRPWSHRFIARDDVINDAELDVAVQRGLWFIGMGPIDRFRSSFELTSLDRARVVEAFIVRYDRGVPDWPIYVTHCVSKALPPEVDPNVWTTDGVE